MKNSTVRGRIIAYFSAMTLLIGALCVCGYAQLQRIQGQARLAPMESVPGLVIADRLQATSISTYTSVQELILERDPSKRQKIKTDLEEKRLNGWRSSSNANRSSDQTGSMNYMQPPKPPSPLI